MSQHRHIQNHAYTNKSMHTYVCHVCQLSNPVYFILYESLGVSMSYFNNLECLADKKHSDFYNYLNYGSNNFFLWCVLKIYSKLK